VRNVKFPKFSSKFYLDNKIKKKPFTSIGFGEIMFNRHRAVCSHRRDSTLTGNGHVPRPRSFDSLPGVFAKDLGSDCRDFAEPEKTFAVQEKRKVTDSGRDGRVLAVTDIVAARQLTNSRRACGFPASNVSLLLYRHAKRARKGARADRYTIITRYLI